MRYTRKNIPLTPFICYLKHDECNATNEVKKIIIDNEIPIFVYHYADNLYYKTFNLAMFKSILRDKLDYRLSDHERYINSCLFNLFNSNDSYNSDTIYFSEIDSVITINEFMKSL